MSVKLDFSSSEAISAMLTAAKNATTPEVPIAEDVAEIIDDIPEEKIIETRRVNRMLAKIACRRRTLDQFPPVVPEQDNPNILIRGRWLERGGSAILVSSAGTGKSIWSIQFALSMVHMQPFCGLVPYRPMRTWIIQSEDSDTRVSIDRDDITAGLRRDFAESETPLDWNAAQRQVTFVDMTGFTGAKLVSTLREELKAANEEGDSPDIIIINPLLDFLGGDANNASDVSAFLSGGRLNGQDTEGMRSIIKEFNCAILTVHHTGKPPTKKELSGWLTNSMSEYQSAGSAYITNWHRSTLTMMKVPDCEGYVFVTAGKNGGGLDWPLIAGARRQIMAWDVADSCGGSGKRHYWRCLKPEDEEFQKVATMIQKFADNKKVTEEDRPEERNYNATGSAMYWAGVIRSSETPKGREDLIAEIRHSGLSKHQAEETWKELVGDPEHWGLVKEVENGRGHRIVLRGAPREVF